MKKLFNISLLEIAILGIFAFLILQLTLFIFDRNMYYGVDVVKQEGNVLFVTIDDQLKTGTDGVCLEATRVLANVALQSGCYIQVVPDKDEWVPFKDMVMSYLDLINIIESGHPY